MHQVGTSSLLIYIMHGHTYIKIVNQNILLVDYVFECVRNFRKATIGFVIVVRLSMCPSAWKSSASSRHIFIKFRIWIFFRGEVKPSVPCRRFAACKRSLNGVEVIISAKLPGQHSRPQFPLPPLGSLTSWRTWKHLVVKSGNI